MQNYFDVPKVSGGQEPSDRGSADPFNLLYRPPCLHIHNCFSTSTTTNLIHHTQQIDKISTNTSTQKWYAYKFSTVINCHRVALLEDYWLVGV